MSDNVRWLALSNIFSKESGGWVCLFEFRPLNRRKTIHHLNWMWRFSIDQLVGR